MRVTVFISAFLHILLMLVAYFGLPHFFEPLDVPPPAFEVELVAENELEEEPEAPAPKPKPNKVTPPPPPPPPKPPEPKPEPKPEPEAKPEPKPEPEAVPIPEKPKPKPVEKKEPPKPKPEPKVEPKPQPVVKMPRPKSKPKEPVRNDFSSVLKTIEKIKEKPKPKVPEPEKKKPKEEDAFAKMTQSLKKKDAKPPQQQSAFMSGESQLSDRELDAVKQQIAGCWNVPAGAMDAENLIVRLVVTMRPDRSVQSVKIDESSNNGNPFWRTAAESARRAVLQCSPLKLPVGKYDVWNIINFTFNPKEMFG